MEDDDDDLLLNSDCGIGCVYSPLGLVIFVAVEGTFVCWSRSLFSNSIDLYCYCAITELVMIRTSTSRTATRANRSSATSKTATRESANVDSAAITSKMALLYKYKINYNA